MSESTTVQIQGLLDRFVGGDEKAKANLIKVAEGRLLVLTRQLLRGFPDGRGHDDTTGIFNEAYLRLHSSLDEVKPTTVRQFFGLAALEIRRTLLDLVRKFRGRGKNPNPKPRPLDPPGTGGQRIDPPVRDAFQERIDLTEALFNAIDKLPDKLQEVTMLHHFQGLRQAEVAGLLGVHEDTVKRWWNEALVELADLLPGYDETASA
jgi:RNA polymerase sigma factor (sigma-70 family)